MKELDGAYGVIETFGLSAAVLCADIAVKSASVRLLGYELVRGRGLIAVKISGNVGAVQAAIQAAKSEMDRLQNPVSVLVIPRPNEEAAPILCRVDRPRGKKADEPDEPGPERDEAASVDALSQEEPPAGAGRTAVQAEESETCEMEGQATVLILPSPPAEATPILCHVDQFYKKKIDEPYKSCPERDETVSAGALPQEELFTGPGEERDSVWKTKPSEAPQVPEGEMPQADTPGGPAEGEAPQADAPGGPAEGEAPQADVSGGPAEGEAPQTDAPGEPVQKKHATCNLCNDPKCPRKKGDPRSDCIHYNELQ